MVTMFILGRRSLSNTNRKFTIRSSNKQRSLMNLNMRKNKKMANDSYIHR